MFFNRFFKKGGFMKLFMGCLLFFIFCGCTGDQNQNQNLTEECKTLETLNPSVLKFINCPSEAGEYTDRVMKTCALHFDLPLSELDNLQTQGKVSLQFAANIRGKLGVVKKFKPVQTGEEGQSASNTEFHTYFREQCKLSLAGWSPDKSIKLVEPFFQCYSKYWKQTYPELKTQYNCK